MSIVVLGVLLDDLMFAFESNTGIWFEVQRLGPQHQIPFLIFTLDDCKFLFQLKITCI